MPVNSLPRRLHRVILVALVGVSVGIVMLATPAPRTPTPPGGQTQVAPLAEPADDPAEVLVPSDMGRVLSPFLAILEGDVGTESGPRTVFATDADSLAYAPRR